MATYNIPIAASPDDYDAFSSNFTTVTGVYNRAVDPPLISVADFKFNTNSIPVTEKVTELKFKYREYSWSASRGEPAEYAIYIKDTLGFMKKATIVSYIGVGWSTVTLPTSFIPYVYKGTGAITWMSIRPDEPKPAGFRSVQVYAWDYGPGTYPPELIITTGAAERSYPMIIG